MENILEMYDDQITREITSQLNFNRVGKTITFEIDGVDSFIHVRQAKYVIKEKKNFKL